MDEKTKERLHWYNQSIQEGDEFVIRVVETNEATKPTKSKPNDEKVKLEAMLQSYLKLKLEKKGLI